MVNAKDSYRIVAARGMEELVGECLFEVMKIAPTEQAKAEALVEKDDASCVIPIENQTLLLFSAWYRHTGLMLAVCLPHPEEKVRKILEFAQRSAIKPLFCADGYENWEDEDLLDLQETFYYLSRIFKPTDEIWNHCLAVANFVGCSLERLSMPISMPLIDDEEFGRLTAFLFCCFMELRHQYGKTSVLNDLQNLENVGKVQVEKDEELHVTVRQDFSAPPKIQRVSSDQSTQQAISFPFASLPAFRGFSMMQDADTLIMQAHFPAKKRLHSNRYPCHARKLTLSLRMTAAS